MAISTIRAVTSDDISKVKKSAEKFCARHNLTPINGDAEMAIAHATYYEHDRKLEIQWKKCLCRALGVSYNVNMTIAYGHIGITC